uniref:Uncharacterized protein n=1 Tax=Acrobeloides nanus TaxID=290746 RepID=A0A914CG28_9BILA
MLQAAKIPNDSQAESNEEHNSPALPLNKHFTRENLWININDRRLMTVQTIYKNEQNKEIFTWAGGMCKDSMKNFIERNAMIKRRHKIYTPPVLFFKILRSLLRDMGEIKHLAFHKFTFTDGFFEKMLFYVDLPLLVTHLHMHDIRRRDCVVKQNNAPNYVNFVTELIQETRSRPKEVAPPPVIQHPAQRPPQVQAMIDMMRNRVIQHRVQALRHQAADQNIEDRNRFPLRPNDPNRIIRIDDHLARIRWVDDHFEEAFHIEHDANRDVAQAGPAPRLNQIRHGVDIEEIPPHHLLEIEELLAMEDEDFDAFREHARNVIERMEEGEENVREDIE